VSIGNRLIGLRCTFWETSLERDGTSSVGSLARRDGSAVDIILYQYDQRVLLDCYYARVLWLQDLAISNAAHRESRRLRPHKGSHALAPALAAHRVVSDRTVCRRSHDRRRPRQRGVRRRDQDGLEIWNVWAQCFKGSCSSSEGAWRGAQLLQSASRDCLSRPFITIESAPCRARCGSRRCRADC